MLRVPGVPKVFEQSIWLQSNMIWRKMSTSHILTSLFAQMVNIPLGIPNLGQHAIQSGSSNNKTFGTRRLGTIECLSYSDSNMLAAQSSP